MLEVMLSIGLFVGAAAFCLGATKSIFVGLERADRRQCAVDLARSRLAELEAGLVAIQALRGEWDGGVGSHPADDYEQTRPQQRRWTINVETSLSEFSGLTLVELTVSEISNPDDAISVTLRQLMSLRDVGVEEYEPDDLFEGLDQETPS